MTVSGDWADALADGLIAMRAHVWWCGDDVCDCTQARIEGATRRGPGGSPWYEETLWTGTFRSGWPCEYDESERAEGGPTTELNREARRLRKRHHALYRRIEWPWDRTRRIVEEQVRESEMAAVQERQAAERAQHAEDAAARTAVARGLFAASVQDFMGGDR